MLRTPPRNSGVLTPPAAADKLFHRWLGVGAAKLLKSEFGIDLADETRLVDLDDVSARYQEYMMELFDVEEELARCDDCGDALMAFNAVNKANAIEGDYQMKFDTIRQLLWQLFNMAQTLAPVNAIAGGATCASLGCSNKDLIRSFRNPRGQLSLIVKAQLFFLELAYKRRLRKQKIEGAKTIYKLFQPLIISGHTTVSYREVGTIEEWVQSVISPDANPDIHAILCSKAATLPSVISFLEKTPDSRLPFYEVTEGAHGFMNGYVLAKTNTVVFYGTKNVDAETNKIVASHHHAGCMLKPEWFKTSPRQRLLTGEVEIVRIGGDESDDEEALADEENLLRPQRAWRFKQQHHDGSVVDVLYPIPEGCADDNFPPLHIQMPAGECVARTPC